MAVRTRFRLRPAFATLDGHPVGLPTISNATGQVSRGFGCRPHCHVWTRVAASRVIRRGRCLACWLLRTNFLRCSLSPSGFSAAQDSKTARLPSFAFIATNLQATACTRITLRKPPPGRPYLLELSSEAWSLRPTRPVAPVLPCDPAVSRRPQQPAARHALYRCRHPAGGTLPTHPSAGTSRHLLLEAVSASPDLTS